MNKWSKNERRCSEIDQAIKRAIDQTELNRSNRAQKNKTINAQSINNQSSSIDQNQLTQIDTKTHHQHAVS